MKNLENYIISCIEYKKSEYEIHLFDHMYRIASNMKRNLAKAK